MSGIIPLLSPYAFWRAQGHIFVLTLCSSLPAAAVCRANHNLLYVAAVSIAGNLPNPHGATAPSGPGYPLYRGFTITLRHTTLGRTPLDE